MPKNSKEAKRVASLVTHINDHNYRYHVLATPVIEDSEYDRLASELQDLERRHPELMRPDSPAQRGGGGPTRQFPSVTHQTPMLSLDNSYSASAVEAFDQRVRDLAPYQLDQRVVDRAGKDVIVMHCLPAHRGEEISAEVLDGPHSVVLRQAENRLHAQKALIAWLLGAEEAVT